ncbi:TRAP-type C4-dicarboxylate transport system, substrate-binding protein [Tindallia magadiensis]|uniref:TRAP-type C4-dicarboxylate transport system, substrate-binding protein n=2 Tax=Tindallia magadiensis TaxID=69895 RepID=A0A1I3C211_9FIRM|nr:TRAP-type C4-dicarboxylate transport system, substrate-binding protein [Tindallia magadiensis]
MTDNLEECESGEDFRNEKRGGERMKKKNGKMKWLALALSVVLLSTLGLAGCGGGDPAPADEPEEAAVERTGEESLGELMDAPLQPRLASEEIEGDFMTVWAEYYADHMREVTDGMYDLTVYPFGTLGDTRDINELAQLGVVEYVFSDYAWISAFVPEAQVLTLHYLWPPEHMPETLDWVVRNGDFMDVLEEAFRRNGLVPLGVLYEGWQTISSNNPIETVDDMQGFKVRVMGSAMLVENYLAYGADPTPLAYGEIYGGLQTNLIDGQINPIFAIRSMNFYEVQNYLTDIFAEPFTGIPTVNMQYFDSLPPEVQEEMRNYWTDAILPSAEWIDARHEEDLAYMLEARPEMEYHQVTGDDLEGFKEASLPVYDKFLEIGGPQAEEILETLLNDIENAKEALGIED